MLSGIDKAMLLCDHTYLILSESSKRKLHMSQLLLRQHIKHVRLILRIIYRFFQNVTVSVRIIFYPCIMTCHNIVVADLLHTVKQLVKFQIAVTVNTRIRCAAVFISFHETIHYLCVEIRCKIKYIIWHIHLIGYASGILHIIQGTAALFPMNADILIIIKFHGCSDTLVTGFLCKKSCHGTVHSTAHCYDCFFHIYF